MTDRESRLLLDRVRALESLAARMFYTICGLLLAVLIGAAAWIGLLILILRR